MDDEECKKRDLDTIMEELKGKLYLECANIRKSLKEYINNNSLGWKLSGIKQGKNSKKTKTKNDYRNYIWIDIECYCNIYRITMFYNDIDNQTGNLHTQFGRIQFWRINKGLRVVNINNMLKWELNSKVSYDPKIWIDDVGYSVQNVISEFNKFINYKI